jgi:hypothetical protein
MTAIVRPSEEELYLLAILMDPAGIDLAEFALTDNRNDDGCYRLHDYQWRWFADDDMYQIDHSGRNIGKELDLDTPVPTPDGWTTMGEIQVGDQVFDERGYVCTVTDAHPVVHDLHCYELTFSDASTIVASGRHRWATYDKRARRARGEGRPYALEVRTTEEIADTVRVGREANHSIPVTQALQLLNVPCLLDPWVLGYWLGNGSKAEPYLTMDRDDRAYVEQQLAARSFKVKALTTAAHKAPMLRFDPVDGHGKEVLRELGVLNDKHVPATYQRLSEGQRRDLLAGLVDSDGHIDHNGSAEVCFTRHQLAQDTFDLLIGLGEKPTIKESRASIAGVDKGPRWRIFWKPRVCPAQMPRKAARWRPAAGKTGERRIVAVTPVTSRPVRCISVDSPSHLFLVGETMIPTHNTESIKLRCLAYPFVKPGKSMLITAPELNHLRPLTDEVEKYLLQCSLTERMMPPGKSRGIARQPHWQVRFANGSSIISRLPNNDGRGVKGQHVDQLEVDEGQDYPAAGFAEIVEAFNAGNDGAMWRIHGVSKGVRDFFYEKTQPSSGWKVHRFMGMHRPTWSDKERKDKIDQYGGSRQSSDYRRNVYGDHGDVQNPVFVLSRLMACVDTDEGSLYNTEIYTPIKISYERFPDAASDSDRLALIDSWIQLPGTHFSGYSQRVKGKETGAPKGYSAYWAGMDVGMTTDPSEILVFGQRKGSDFLELLTRIQMHRINADDQKAVIQKVMDFYGPKLQFGIDKTGLGHMLWDELTRYPFGDRIHGFGFSEKRIVGFEDREMTGKETLEDLAMRRNMVEASTDWLRNDYVDTKQFRLPYDREILLEFQGQTYMSQKDSGDPYNGTKRVFGGGTLHTLDAAKVAIAARHIPPLEERLLQPVTQVSVLDYFVG